MSELVFLFDVTSLESLLSLSVESSLFEVEVIDLYDRLTVHNLKY